MKRVRWETVTAKGEEPAVFRLKVPGGWFYRTECFGALVFVHEPFALGKSTIKLLKGKQRDVTR